LIRKEEAMSGISEGYERLFFVEKGKKDRGGLGFKYK